MAKTYLQLCQRLRQEVGGAGTGPSSVTSQTGELGRIVSWIVEADEEVQQEHDDWLFMVGSFQINTVADDGEYSVSDCVTPITDLRKWKEESFKIYLSASGVSDETQLHYIDYQNWYEIFNTGTQTSSRPMYFTISPSNTILLAPKPSAVYRVTGQYHRSVDTLTLASDEPIYPAEFHMLPVYLGMMKYGRYTGASEVYTDGERLYTKMLSRMRRTQLPRFRPVEPMV
jgi:hypothetical protein